MDTVQVLNERDISQVSGALWANALGGVAGGVGGFYGAIIGGGSDATLSDIATGTLTGMAAGVLSPVRGFSSLATSVGGGIITGAITSTVDDVKEAFTTDE